MPRLVTWVSSRITFLLLSLCALVSWRSSNRLVLRNGSVRDVDVVLGGTKNADPHVFLVSGGFATVHPNNKLTINAVEAAPLEDFSVEVCTSGPIWIFFSVVLICHSHFPQSIRANLQEALKVASGNGSEEDKLEARIEAEVYESLQYALGSK